MSEPLEQFAEPVPLEGFWQSTSDDVTQQYELTGPEGYIERRPYAPVEQVKRAPQIIATRAAYSAAQARADVEQVLIDAGDNTSIIYSQNAPTEGTPLSPEGSTWYQFSPETGNIIGSWRATDSEWMRYQLNDDVVATLTAGKITSGSLQVGVAISVGSESDNHVVLASDGLHVMADPDGSGVREVAQMGTGSAAVWSVTGPQTPGENTYPILAQATTEGDLVGRSLSVADDVYIGGEPLSALLTSPVQVAGMFTSSSDMTTHDRTWKNAGMLTFPVTRGNMYIAILTGRWGLDTAADGRLEMALSSSQASSQSDVPPNPWVNGTSSRRLATWGASVDAHMEAGAKHGFTYVHAFSASATRNFFRLGFAFNNWGNTAQVRLGAGSSLIVLDMGPMGSATAGYQLNAPTPADQLPSDGGEQTTTVEAVAERHERIYKATSTRSWKSGSPVSNVLYHGTPTGSQPRGTWATFGPGLTTDTKGKQVEKVELWLECQHTYYAAGANIKCGTVLSQTGTPMSAPASQLTSGTYPVTHKFRGGDSKWVPLNQVAIDRLKTGQFGGIYLGEGASSGYSDYAYFRNALSAVRLRVTYID